MANPSKTFPNFNNTTITYGVNEDQKTIDTWTQEGTWTTRVFRRSTERDAPHFGGDISKEYYGVEGGNNAYTINKIGDTQARNNMNIQDVHGLSVFTNARYLNSSPPFLVLGSIVDRYIDNDFVCIHHPFDPAGRKQEGHLLITNGNALNNFSND